MEEQDRVFQSAEFNPARRRRIETVKAFFIPLLEVREQSMNPLKKINRERRRDRFDQRWRVIGQTVSRVQLTETPDLTK
ncbi:MAG: hypothetical protein AMJ88_18295 [Anaerolineae bacterium SM23_ 63]|nr:MAG: hypothetical protein AMJ88_18295 [Anaerolineae bacterium SM23_ 63]